jgi:chemotaxis protein MotA
MAKSTEEEHAFYHVIRVVIVAFIIGAPPTVAVEFGRRAIPGAVRPKFQELEDFIKNRAGAGEAAAAEPAAPAA